MLVEQELAAFAPAKKTVLTVGIFDGVHLGHKHLLGQLKEQARAQNALSGVITFRQHPDELLGGKQHLPYLTSLEQRVSLLRAEGVDLVAILSFDHELAGLDARRFIGLLQQHLKMKGLVVGPDFALGKGRQGGLAYLSKLGKETGFTLAVVPPIKVGEEVVSSTNIRQALADGDMERVRRLAGRFFSFTGTVVKGLGRGRQIGYPTANLEVNAGQALPPYGIYATLAHLGDAAHQSVASIGVRPTFTEGFRTIEVFILDFQGNLYGQEMRVEFVAKLREEKKFSSVGELKKAIAADVEQGRTVLEKVP
jgi:riboflavin kinase/FMN adenylyltransferase